MKIKLIDLLREDEDNIKAASAYSNAIKGTSVSDFVDSFKNIAADPKVQAIVKAGVTDGNPDDEKLPYEKQQIKVDTLIPTQSEIGFNQSIENILTDQYGSLASIFSGLADVGGPIVTYNGKYIIDGHHRWSQVFAANPKAKMEALNITGNLKPEEILKIVHSAIAIKTGGVPSANPKGINILNGITEEQVLEAVNSKLTDKAKKLWADHGQKDNESIAKYLYNNLEVLINNHKPISGAPGRKDMPQTDAGDKDIEKTLNYVKSGIVNFKDPKPEDIQEIRRLKKLAGI
jgi:hypothetical protein